MDTMASIDHANEPRRRVGAQVGYASYSKREGRAGLNVQLAKLERSGCQTTRSEEVGSSSERKVLARLLHRLKAGDVLTVTKLDRLARSAQEAADIAQALRSRGAALCILNLDLDTGTATGNQVLQLLAAAAELERTVGLDKQHEDKQRMIDHLSHKINIRVSALENLARVDALRGEDLTAAQMARRLGLSKTVVRHACWELSCRERFKEYDDPPTLEHELSRLRHKLAATIGEHVSAAGAHPCPPTPCEASAPVDVRLDQKH